MLSVLEQRIGFEDQSHRDVAEGLVKFYAVLPINDDVRSEIEQAFQNRCLSLNQAAQQIQNWLCDPTIDVQTGMFLIYKIVSEIACTTAASERWLDLLDQVYQNGKQNQVRDAACDARQKLMEG